MFFYVTFLLMFVILLSSSIFFITKHRGNRLIFWASLIIFCGGLVGLQVVLEKVWLPYSIEQKMSASLIDISVIVTTFLNVIIHTFPYYGILIFFIIYNEYHYNHKWLPFILSLPPWFTLFFQTKLLENQIDNRLTAIWGLCYICATFVLAVRPIVKEHKRKQRVNHSIIALIFLIPVVTLNIYHFSDRFISEKVLLIIPITCVISLLLIFFLYVRDTFLGAKRTSVQIVHVGTGLIHHSLKNSIGKIKLNALAIRKNLHAGQHEEIDPYIDNLLKIHMSMLERMTKISHGISDNTHAKKEIHDLSSILDEVLESLKIPPNIHIHRQYTPLKLFMDRLMITECLENICNNAIDAMKEDGILYVNLEARRNKVLLTIRDTGCGMTSLQLQNIFEPFYSTKNKSGDHFGLGMYQVKKVINAHNGKISIKSRQDGGTTVILTFKKRAEKNDE